MENKSKAIQQFHEEFLQKYGALLDDVLDTSDLSALFSLVVDAMQMISSYDTLSGPQKKAVIIETILNICPNDDLDTVLYHLIDTLVAVDKDKNITFQPRQRMTQIYRQFNLVGKKLASWSQICCCKEEPN
jgi:hypothetical protein